MSKERIAGMMMGLGVGVAIGYYLRPHKTGANGKSNGVEASPHPGSVALKPLSEAAVAVGAGSERSKR